MFHLQGRSWGLGLGLGLGEVKDVPPAGTIMGAGHSKEVPQAWVSSMHLTGGAAHT